MTLGSLLVRQTGPHNNIHMYIQIAYNESYIHTYTHKKGERGARSDMNRLSLTVGKWLHPIPHTISIVITIHLLEQN